jgi:hypothetical protein
MAHTVMLFLDDGHALGSRAVHGENGGALVWSEASRPAETGIWEPHGLLASVT